MKATKERIELKLRGLRAKKSAIQDEIDNSTSIDWGLLKEMREVDDQIAKGGIELADEVKMKLTKDEKISHAMLGGLTGRPLRASRRAGERSTPYCLASVLKCWSTR